MLGNGRLEAMCFDGQKRLGNIRGKLRKKVWINREYPPQTPFPIVIHALTWANRG